MKLPYPHVGVLLHWKNINPCHKRILSLCKGMSRFLRHIFVESDECFSKTQNHEGKPVGYHLAMLYTFRYFYGIFPGRNQLYRKPIHLMSQKYTHSLQDGIGRTNGSPTHAYGSVCVVKFPEFIWGMKLRIPKSHSILRSVRLAYTPMIICFALAKLSGSCFQPVSVQTPLVYIRSIACSSLSPPRFLQRPFCWFNWKLIGDRLEECLIVQSEQPHTLIVLQSW